MVYTYKVAEYGQRKFPRDTTAKGLEFLINENAKDGWMLDQIVAGDSATGLGLHDAFLLIFKKQQPATKEP